MPSTTEAAENSITGNIQRDCGEHLGRKLLIFAFVFLPAWTVTKIPYYIQFNAQGDTPYEKGGLTGSINLEHWISGYNGSKLRSPACNFLLVHIAFGITVLIMMALSLIKKSWRKKYGYYFFTFAICLAVHSVPAALMMPQLPLRILFTFTCAWVFAAAVFGFITLRNYDEDPEKAERHLLIEYGLISFGAYGAGFAEFTGIAAKIRFRLAEGYWTSYGDSPDPRFGHTVYNLLPEKYGMTFFFVFISIYWFYWPIKLVEIDTTTTASSPPANETKNDEGSANEQTSLLDRLRRIV